MRLLLRQVDAAPRPDQAMLIGEERRQLAGSQTYLRRLRVLMALGRLPVEDADLVRQVLAGASEEELEASTPGAKKRLSRSVQRLKRALSPPARLRCGEHEALASAPVVFRSSNLSISETDNVEHGLWRGIRNITADFRVRNCGSGVHRIRRGPRCRALRFPVALGPTGYREAIVRPLPSSSP